MRLQAFTIVSIALTLAGCRASGGKGAFSRSLVASRQFCQQGVSAVERGHWERAEDLLGQAVEVCPIDPDARRHYSETLWHRGKRDEAVSQLEEACRLAVDDAGLHARLAKMRIEMGDLESARRQVEHALDIDPKLAEAWAIRGRVNESRGELEQALSDYHRALALAPEQGAIELEIAELYRRLNRPEQALAALYRLADRCSPGEEPQQVLYLQGLAYGALERWDDAVRRFSAACEREGPTAEILFHLAEAEWFAGRPAAAAAAAREALVLDPQHQPSRTLLGQAELVLEPGDTLRR